MPPTFTFATDHAPRKVTTARQVHIRRLFDLLELSIQRHDSHSARRAWSILCRCKDVQWKHLWRLGLLMLSEDRGQSTPVEYLRAMMFQHPEQKESILQEIVHVMVTQENYRDALTELQLYLPSLPYQENPILHTYAGMLSLYLAQPSVQASAQTFSQYSQFTNSNHALLRDVETHLNKVLSLDPDNNVAVAMLQKARDLYPENTQQHPLFVESDIEMDSEERLTATPPLNRMKGE